eukprot:jgi/Bigna1/76520/fgenesh1_pg.41_\
MGMTAQSSSGGDPGNRAVFRSASIRWAVRVSKWDPTVTAYKEALALLHEDEAKRVAKFRFFDDAKRSLMGRLLVRKLLKDIMQMPTIDLKRTQKGKPYIANPQECPIEELKHMQFNVSHHGDWVVLAAESCFSVGIDVMGIERPGRGSLGSFFKNMRSNFSEGEWSHVMADEGGDRGRLTRFMRLWTLKESYVKARGEGLSISPNRVCFEMRRRRGGTTRPATTSMRQKPISDGEGDEKDGKSINGDQSSSSSSSSSRSSIFRDRKCWEEHPASSISNKQPVTTRRRQDFFLQGKYEREGGNVKEEEEKAEGGGEGEREEEKARNGDFVDSGGGLKAAVDAPKLFDPYTDMSHLPPPPFDSRPERSIRNTYGVLPACIPPRTSANSFKEAVETALVSPFYELDPTVLVAGLKKSNK